MRIARSVLRHGRTLDQAVDALRNPVPDSWRAGIAGKVLELVERRDSEEDGASKLIFSTPSGKRIESVLLRIASGRTSLCVSIQSRCPVACSFCASGFLGKPESLSLAELLDQVVQARQVLRTEQRDLRNLVFMGMGEPLMEENLLHAALERLTDPASFALSAKNIMVSTVGLPAEMQRLARAFPDVRQALSLHSARAEVRASLIPMARRVSLEELREAVIRVAEISDAKVLIEYLLLAGVTDRPSDEAALAIWLEGLPILLNLIPFNRPQLGAAKSSIDPDLRPTSQAEGEAFALRFRQRGVSTTLRHSLGRDIFAACGQLAATTP
ncbi:MAG: 23S rRNA (adenine2503-C2)-methyltransferase [Planctomycetota bacterium]|jgi:23S rRNA (adenine2503-C2)-methyltransferase